MPPYKGSSGGVVLNSVPYAITNYVCDELPPLAQQQRVGPPDFNDRAGEDIQAQSSWHNGMGRAEIRDARDLHHYSVSSNADARYRGVFFLGPLVNTATFTTNAEAKVQFIEFNGTWFAIGARYVHSLSGTTWTVDKDMGATAAAVKGAATIFGGKLYVGAGSAVDFWARDSAGTWTQPAAGQKATLMASVGLNIWLVVSGNQLKSSTDGITWLTAVSVGSSLDVATSLLDYNGFPYVGKPDGFFYYDGTAVWNGLPEIAQRKAANNCKGAAVARGRVYLPVGGSVVAYSADSVQTDLLNPGMDRFSQGATRGTFGEFWADADFLWGIFAAASGDSYIAAYDFNSVAGQGWHTVVVISGLSFTALGVQASGSPPRLWFSDGTALKYFNLPSNGQNPLEDSSYAYAASGGLTLSLDPDFYDDIPKSQISIVTDTGGCAAGQTVVVSYASGSDTVRGSYWGLATALVTYTTNGLHEFFWTLPTGNTGRRFLLSVSLTTNDSTKTPRVYLVAKRFARRFPRRRRWAFDVATARGAAPNVPTSELEQLVTLETARAATAPVTFTDKDGRTAYVYVEYLGDAQPKNEVADAEGLVHVVLVEHRTS